MDIQLGEQLVCDGTATNWHWQPVDLDDPAWAHMAIVINGFYTPGENHGMIWPQLRRLLFETIYRGAQTPVEEMEKAHAPGILAYLRREIDRDLPEPQVEKVLFTT